MQLTRYTDYSLRILIYLALLPKDEKANVDKISQVYGISRNNVNKIVHQLGKSGIIETKRGKGGGFYLARNPNQINVGEMVVLTENNLQVIDCEKPTCKILPACTLKGILAQATASFINTLKQYSLADLIDSNQGQLIQILHLDSTQ